MKHATLSPSKRHRWAVCPGSIREEAKYPESNGPAAVDGTHSHTLLDHCIGANRPLGPADPMALVGIKMKDHEGEFVVDAERAARVKVATDYVRSRIEAAMGLCTVIPEETVNPQFLTSRDDLKGTADIQIYDTLNRVLEIIDYKDGMNDAWDSAVLQMEQYALGALAELQIARPNPYPFDTVRMTVVQPKLALKGGQSIRSIDVPVQYVLDTIGREIVLQAAATDKEDAPLVPGEGQCKFCRAKGGCSALAGSVMKEIGVMFQPPSGGNMLVEPGQFFKDTAQLMDNAVASVALDVAQQSANKNPATMDADQIRQILEAAPLMRQLLEAVEEEALRRMQAGQVIPGLKLVNGRGSRAWALPEAEMEGALTRMGVPKSAVYVTKMVSPAQAEKLTWEKRDGTKMQLSPRQLKRLDSEYIVKMAGKLTVAPESDSRPAVTLNAAPLFGAVEAAPAVESLPSWLS